jgi:ABC-type multidrug transport system ATPase subunit
MEEHPIAVNIDGVTKRYAKTSATALNNLTLQVPLGKICCLLGPNGSGKTTLLKMVAGLLRPTSGKMKISIMGEDIEKDPLESRKQIGWMPAEERSGFYGRLTAKQNLEFFAALQGVAPKEVNRIIGNLAFLLDFNDELDKMFLKTSAGARQKFGLARVLLHDPGILLLDEPMRNLDPHAVLRFRRLLKDHLTRREKKTVLLSTHQLEEARRIADHIIILHKGEILKSLSARDLETELGQKSLEEFYLKIIDIEEKTA